MSIENELMTIQNFIASTIKGKDIFLDNSKYNSVSYYNNGVLYRYRILKRTIIIEYRVGKKEWHTQEILNYKQVLEMAKDNGY